MAAWPRRPATLGALLWALGMGPACYDFHLAGPEEPPAVPISRLVSVTVEYHQPPGCISAAGRCSDNVTFHASWMRPGSEFFLRRGPTSYVWTGTAVGVPVNFPPQGEPYLVRVYDPHLDDGGPTGGLTAQRLTVGRERIARFDPQGGFTESGLIYIDDNGLGHSPY